MDAPLIEHATMTLAAQAGIRVAELVVAPSANGKLRLAPAYDVLPTNSGQGYQEFICGTDGQESTLTNAMSQCEAFGLNAAEAAAQVAQVISVVNNWREHFAAAGVSQTDIDNLAERIDGEELLNQRQDFDPGQYSAAPTRRRSTNPFRRG